MAKRRRSGQPLSSSTEPLYREIREVLESARARAYRAVNAAMVQAYWQVGRLIVEHEQKGRRRAGYGDVVIATLAARLTRDLGRGFDERNLWYMRRFYLAFPILNAPRSESEPAEKQNLPRSGSAALPVALPPELSWTHFRLLLKVEDTQARDWYMREAADQHWSTRQLERQISVLYYERLLASRKKAPVRAEAAAKLARVQSDQFIRDPYVLEFLDLKDYPGLRETAVEQAVIDNLQAFLLELGKGFSFVARQKRMRFDEAGKLTHQDIGQMDSYVRMFDAHARPEGDNPTIGLILCSGKNEAIAKYSVLSEGRQIFAAKYMKILPTEAQLAREMERERQLIDGRRGDEGER